MRLRRGRSGTFHEERAGLNRSNFVIASVLVLSCATLSIVWFVFVSGYFTVVNIQTDQLQSLKREEVASTTWDVLDNGKWKPWSKRNILLIDSQDLALQLREQLFAENVTVEKSYPNVLRLLITERQRSVIVAANSQLLNVDTNGIVTGDAQDDDANQSRLRLNRKALADFVHKPVIETDLVESATVGYQITDSDIVRRWIESYRAFIGAGMKFRYLHLTSPSSTTVEIITDAGYLVIIDMLAPVEPQVSTYLKFLRSKPKDFKIEEYVDVRIPGKIFAK